MFGLPLVCPFNTAVVTTFFIGLFYNLHLKRATVFSKIFLKFAPLNTALTFNWYENHLPAERALPFGCA